MQVDPSPPSSNTGYSYQTPGRKISESAKKYGNLWCPFGQHNTEDICWDELDFTDGQNIGSSVELSWHLRATSSELVANDA